jgi:universal stress protein E
MDEKVIVCPTDFTASSDGALRYASSLARQTNAKLLIIHVEPPDGQSVASIVTPEATVPIGEEGAESSRPRIVAPDCEGVKYEYMVRQGEPADEILRLAHEKHATQIVMGGNGRHTLHHAQWGHTAERVVDNASCPVTIVRNEDLS